MGVDREIITPENMFAEMEGGSLVVSEDEGVVA
jgi:hypothetical protein